MNDNVKGSSGGDQRIRTYRRVTKTCEKLNGFMSFLMLINLFIGLVFGILSDRRSNKLNKERRDYGRAA